MSDTVILEETRSVTTDDGDHDRFAHFVMKTALEGVWLNGVPAVALCGKKWLPTKDPSRFPVCPECKEIWESMEVGPEL